MNYLMIPSPTPSPTTTEEMASHYIKATRAQIKKLKAQLEVGMVKPVPESEASVYATPCTAYSTPRSQVFTAPPGLPMPTSSAAVPTLVLEERAPTAVPRVARTSRRGRSSVMVEALPLIVNHLVDGGRAPPPPPPPPPVQPHEDERQPDKKERKKQRKSIRPAPSGDPGDDDSSDSSSSGDGYRRLPPQRRHEPRRPRSPKVYKCRNEKIALGSWPSTLEFPAWKRNMRSEVVAACDHPEEAKLWIFDVERFGCTMDEMQSSIFDPLRSLDAKLQSALNKITKGDQQRKLAIIMEQLALTGQMLSGRQHLLFMFLEFSKDGHRTDGTAYTNFEAIRYPRPSTDEAHLESFLTLWDQLLMSFKTQPSEDHLYSKFCACVKNLPGLKIVMEYVDRVDYGHDDKSYDYVMGQARRLVDKRRLAQQTLDVSRMYHADQHHALAASPVTTKKGGGKGDKKEMPCFALRDKGVCEDDECPYSHDPEKIKAHIEAIAARAAKKEAGADTAKGKGQGKGLGKGKGSRPCWDFQAGKCTRGANCAFSHEKAATAAPAATAEPEP
jgi:hypothetical protein